MRNRKIIPIFFVFLTALTLATGLAIRVKFKLVATHYDPKYVDGKFYRRPIHPGFITQTFPELSIRVVRNSGPLENGLPTARQFEKVK